MMIYLQNIIEGLEYLGSYEFQKTAWFENDQGLSSCFAEDVEAVFMDTGLEDAFKEKKLFLEKILMSSFVN